MAKRWFPRSSSIGNYFSCLQRAAFDRAIHHGLLNVEELGLPEQGCHDTKYADYGSVVHHAWQSLVASTFGSKEPTIEEQLAMRTAASRLTSDDLELLDDSVNRAAQQARDAMPVNWEGLDWVAELDCKPKGTNLTGHIDLYCGETGQFIDLKTTGRKPDHNRAKPSHLYQIAAYSILLKKMGLKSNTGYLLYVESVRARWAILCEIDCTTPEWLEFEEHIESFLKFLTSAQLFKQARPNIGSHCTAQFCPYASICRDKYLPGPGQVFGSLDNKAPLRANMETTL